MQDMDYLDLGSFFGLLESIECPIKFLSCKSLWKTTVHTNPFGGLLQAARAKRWMDYVFTLVHKYSQIVKKHQLMFYNHSCGYYNHNILGPKITWFHSQGIKITAVIYKQVYYVSSHSVSEAIGSLLKTFKGFNVSNWIMHTLGHMHNSLGQTKNKSDSISLCPAWLTSPIVTFSTSKAYHKEGTLKCEFLREC